MGDAEDFESLGLGDKRLVLRRLAALEQQAAEQRETREQRPIVSRLDALEDALFESDDRLSALSVDLGFAFLLIAGLAFLMSKSNG